MDELRARRVAWAILASAALGGGAWAGGEIDERAAPPALPQVAVCATSVDDGPRMPRSPVMPPQTVYLSAIMPIPDATDLATIAQAFRRFVDAKYGVHSPSPRCVGAMSQGEAQKMLDVDFRQSPEKDHYVPTGWTVAPTS
jgi:hypothetical protein